MKIICGERVLDLDRMNAIKPDGEHVWVEVQPFTYSPGRLPEGDTGTYLLTPDQGAVSFRDLAFKILIDMGAWSGARCVKYLMRDIARGVDRLDSEYQTWDTASLPDSGAGGVLRGALGLRSIYMPCPGGILRSNLGALLDGPCDLDDAVFGMLSDYIYISDGAAFSAVHDSMSKLLESFGPDSFVQFVEGVYGVVSSDPEDIKNMRQPSPADEKPGQELESDDGIKSDMSDTEDGTQSDTAASEPVSQLEPEAESDMKFDPEPPKTFDLETLSNASVRNLPRGLGLFSVKRELKGSDLTGTDETYSMEYYSGFYRDAMEKADSTGFADQLIKARAGHGTAPIAILEEAVTKLKSAVEAQHESGANTSDLRGTLSEMARALMDAAGKLEALPEPEPEQEVKSEPESRPEPEQAESKPDDAGQAPGIPAVPDEIPDEMPEQPAESDQASSSEPDIPDVPDAPDEDAVAPDDQTEQAQEPEFDIPNYGDDDDDFDAAGGYDEERPEEELAGEPDDDEP